MLDDFEQVQSFSGGQPAPRLDTPAPMTGKSAVTLLEQVRGLVNQGDFTTACDLCKTVLGLPESSGETSTRAEALALQGTAEGMRGNPDVGLHLLGQAERIYVQLGDLDEVVTVKQSQANLYAGLNQLPKAVAVSKEAEAICRQAGNRVGLAINLSNLIGLAGAAGDYVEAKRIAQEAERVCREVGEDGLLERTLSNKAVVLAHSGDFDGCQGTLGEVAQLQQRAGQEVDYALSIYRRALVLANHLGRTEEAKATTFEALSILMRHGHPAVGELQQFLEHVRFS